MKLVASTFVIFLSAVAMALPPAQPDSGNQTPQPPAQAPVTPPPPAPQQPPPPLVPRAGSVGTYTPTQMRPTVPPVPVTVISVVGSPINMTPVTTPGWMGDNPAIPHEYIRDGNIPAYIAANPPTKLPDVDLNVLGGGIAGIYATNEARKKGLNVKLDELNAQFGGNSRSNTAAGVLLQNDASYFDIPEKGDLTYDLLVETNLDKSWTAHFQGDDSIFLDGVEYPKPWINGTSLANRAQFQALDKFFRDMYAGNLKDNPYPNIPPKNAKEAAYVAKLDKMTMHDYVEQVILKGILKPGEHMDPDVFFALDSYFRSANAVSLQAQVNPNIPALGVDAMSAAAGLNFLVGDYVAGMINLPGGNATLAQRLMEILTQNMPAANLRGNSMVLKVSPSPDGSGIDVITMDTTTGKLFTTHSKDVAFALPSNQAKILIDGYAADKARMTAVSKIKKRAYLVMTAVFNQEIQTEPGVIPPFDIYFGKRSTLQLAGAQQRYQAQGGTDPVYIHTPGQTTVNLYQPVTYDGARMQLINPNSDTQVMATFMAQLQNEICPQYGLKIENLASTSVANTAATGGTIFGHAIPASLPGTQAAANIAFADMFGGRLKFIGQDRRALPGLESILADSFRVVNEVAANPEPKMPSIAPAPVVSQAKDEITAKRLRKPGKGASKGKCPFMVAEVSDQ